MNFTNESRDHLPDPNILLYSISTADDEVAKRHGAIQLLDRTDCVLSVQVLQECYAHAHAVQSRDR